MKFDGIKMFINNFKIVSNDWRGTNNSYKIDKAHSMFNAQF